MVETPAALPRGGLGESAAAGPDSAVRSGATASREAKAASRETTKLKVRFASPKIGRGYLLVYVGTHQVLRETVEWTKRVSIFRSEETGGTLVRTVDVPVGANEVRVNFVNRDRGIDLHGTESVHLAAGGGRTLSIRIDELGRRLSIDLR